jgi:hypothetical protein
MAKKNKAKQAGEHVWTFGDYRAFRKAAKKEHPAFDTYVAFVWDSGFHYRHAGLARDIDGGQADDDEIAFELGGVADPVLDIELEQLEDESWAVISTINPCLVL